MWATWLACATDPTVTPSATGDAVVWRLAIDETGNFAVAQGDFPFARGVVVSSALTGRLIQPALPDAGPWNGRCAWNYARLFSWVSAVEAAWRADGLTDPEWRLASIPPLPGADGHACSPTEWWDLGSAARQHLNGAEYTCEQATESAILRSRCREALSYRAAAHDFITMLDSDWRFEVGRFDSSVVDFLAYGEEVVVLRGPAGLSTFSATVRVGALEGRATCTNSRRDEDLWLGTQLAIVSALDDLRAPTGNDYHLPWLAIRWRPMEVSQRIPGGSDLPWTDLDPGPYAAQVLELAAREGDWKCTASGR